MAKGYLYEVTFTIEGHTYTDKVITTSATITEDSRFGGAKFEDGQWYVRCGQFNHGIKNIVTEETSEFGRVDYNHTTGNKVFIKYWFDEYDDIRKDVVSVTDDFVPESEGATYVFRTPSGQIEYVVGQTYSDGDGGNITFSGLWADEVADSEVQIWPTNNQSTACQIRKYDADFEIWCPRT